MPLSEHEQRLLDQIERALYAEDPKFASTVRSTDLRSHMRRRLRRAALVLALGFGLMLAGVVAQQFVLGVAGFVVMLGALLLALSSWKRLGSGPAPGRSSPWAARHRHGPQQKAPRTRRAGRLAGPARGAVEAPLGRARRRRPLASSSRRARARRPLRPRLGPWTAASAGAPVRRCSRLDAPAETRPPR